MQTDSLLQVFWVVICDGVVGDATRCVSAPRARVTRAATRARRRRTRGAATASHAQPQSRAQPHQARPELTTAAAVHEEVDGEVEEVDELEQLLPGELAARRLDAAADQVVDDGLDAEHVRRQVEQHREAAEHEQHPRRAELRLTARQSRRRLIRLHVGELQRRDGRRSVVTAGADARSCVARSRCSRIDASADVTSSDAAPPSGSGGGFVANLMCMLPLADTDVWTRERRRRMAAAAAAATAARFGDGSGGSNADV